ncbi:MAG: hypothetical protein IPK02_20835 [Candidatus Accumulibacter sp.]|uniref:Uncharacterized protein n=1 Tax=Candidatus Accumulibacter affinis TaxID=2954384 RepID=A0A935TCS2_9PROT|nr:hypothetical protein [Candidatus Accumulibacter affinis]
MISSLAQLIIDAAESSVRFRVYECLRTIKLILRGAQSSDSLSVETKALLFRLYQLYVFSPKEETLWCISTYLKDKELEPKQIQWLIENVDQSVHLLNRLLKYPVPNRLIEKWAAGVFQANSYPDRTAEIAGLLIKTSFPPSLTGAPADTLLWAAYFSKASTKQKEEMILQAVTPESAESALEIALRLRLPNVLHRLTHIVPEEGG